MWLFTREGFFSVVQHDKDEAKVLIRARVDNDLTRLLDYIKVEYPDIEFTRWEDTYSDYRYRLVMDRILFAEYMATAVIDLNYTTNVKGELDQGDDARHSAMMQVWGAMMGLQPDGGWSGYKDDRESGLFEDIHRTEGDAEVYVTQDTGEVAVVFPNGDDTPVNDDDYEERVR